MDRSEHCRTGKTGADQSASYANIEILMPLAGPDAAELGLVTVGIWKAKVRRIRVRLNV